ncbi:MAG: LacI family DNA-binding transcriptional regulator [Saccharofermentanales bacterium]|jgi:DNA-binding LacI/PurR family transcriptional regulator
MIQTNRRTTLKDVAREAGVSAMAVSKVLNGKGGISPETSKRIREAAKKLNYQPDNIAKSLRVQETNTLGLVMGDSSQLVFAKVLRGVQDAAAAAGHSVIVANTDQDVEKEKRAVELLLRQRIDGLILAAPLRVSPEALNKLQDNGTPTVLLMRSSPGLDIDSIENDNFQGGYDIVDYLLKTGSRDIWFLSLPLASQPSQVRMRGYRQAFRDHGLTLAENQVVHCEPYIEAGAQAMTRLLDNGLKSGTICCGCDLIAVGAINVIRKRGFSVPEDFRVTGYDDIDLMDYLEVPLTTIRQPKYEIGNEGVQLLIERIQNPQRIARHLSLHSDLIIRKST